MVKVSVAVEVLAVLLEMVELSVSYGAELDPVISIAELVVTSVLVGTERYPVLLDNKALVEFDGVA